MTASPRSARKPGRHGQRGYVLVTGLLFLIVLTLLGIGLYRSTGLMNRISANTRDKERSFEAAQAALQYAEWSLTNGAGADDTCTGLVSGNTVANVHACTNALGSAADLPWTNGFTYTPPNLAVDTNGGLVSSTNPDVNYQAPPSFYIEPKGFAPDGKSKLYEVTAAGFGGNASTKSVVRSTYAITSSSTCRDCP